MFLDEFVDEFYEKLGLDFRATVRPGHLCTAPVLYSYENGELWRPSRFDESQTAATGFGAIPRPANAYRQASIIHSPRLEAYEEFPVIRAKIRPVVLFVPDPPEIQAKQLRGGGRINRHLCLAAPCYSVVDAMGRAKYSQDFLNRVRLLEYPQFMLLPQGPCLKNDSLLRLDSLNQVFRNELQATQWSLSEEIRKILSGQITYLFTKMYQGEYKTARDLLLTQS